MPVRKAPTTEMTEMGTLSGTCTNIESREHSFLPSAKTNLAKDALELFFVENKLASLFSFHDVDDLGEKHPKEKQDEK